MSSPGETEGVAVVASSGNYEMKYSAEDDKSRASVYGLFAKLYDGPPSAEMIKELKKIEFFVLSSSSTKDSSWSDLEFDVDVLNSEYARLFLGPAKHVSPFGSVYRKDDSRSGELWGSSTGEVKRFIEHYGLSFNRSGAIPDHIAILFEFMERVIRAKLKASVSSSVDRSERKETILQARRVEEQFFNGYIDPWIDEFLVAVEEANPHPFYRTLAEQTRTFIAEERMHLSH